jgi:hypothetical protein
MNITIKSIIAVVVLLLLAVLGFNLVHKVDDTEWQAVQRMSGEVEIKDNAGVYFAFFPKVTEYDRNVGFEFRATRSGEDKEEHPDESIRVTFNDGGTAQVSASLRIAMPLDPAKKREFHRQFVGNRDNIKMAVKAHLDNVLKATGPIMSSTEHQASRKSEFTNLVNAQMNDGLYEMKRVSVELDQLDEKGNKLRVAATEVQRDLKTGKPLISQVSPLTIYGITVNQLSIMETEYDAQTQAQFGTKKAAFLKAESAKAEREGEVQQRLMIEEKGLRELAETTAASNLVKAKATITADQEKEVAETEAAKILAVATQTKLTAETQAQQELEVAKINRMASEETAKQILILAQAEKDRIALGGAISEKDKVTLEVQRETAIGVANALAKINVPQVTIGGSAPGTNGSNNQADLINLFLLKQNGLLDAMRPPVPATSASNN